MKLWKFLKIEGFVLMYIIPPLWPAYIGERITTFAKAYGVLIWRTCWGTNWEPIKNLEGTPWEHIGKHGKIN
jgi:hypothetical protein